MIRLALVVIGLVGWIWFALLSLAMIVVGAMADRVPDYWMLDWHVYYAGAHDLIDRDLYRANLSVPGWALPTDVFNLPPASALVAVPFAILGREVGGVVWLLTGLAALIAAVLIAIRLTGARSAWAWAGGMLLVYTAYPGFASHVLLGNNNHVVLLVLTGFAWAHLRTRPGLSGALLGVAIAVKLWPIALMPLLLRDRQWGSLAVACGVTLAVSAGLLAWLGVDSVPHMAAAIRTSVPTDDQSPYIWTTWARENWSWWPEWLAPVLGWILALSPVHGLAAVGLGFIGGVMLVNNIWSHYLPTMLVGLAFVAMGAAELLRRRRSSRLARVLPG